jgi:hypothetical protein
MVSEIIFRRTINEPIAFKIVVVFLKLMMKCFSLKKYKKHNFIYTSISFSSGNWVADVDSFVVNYLSLAFYDQNLKGMFENMRYLVISDKSENFATIDNSFVHIKYKNNEEFLACLKFTFEKWIDGIGQPVHFNIDEGDPSAPRPTPTTKNSSPSPNSGREVEPSPTPSPASTTP